jgi:hypothetical protein
MLYWAHMTVCMHQFQGIRTMDGHCANKKELRSKHSEMENGGERTFCVDVSCGEKCTLLTPRIFSTKTFKMCELFSQTLYKPHPQNCMVLIWKNNNMLPFQTVHETIRTALST